MIAIFHLKHMANTWQDPNYTRWSYLVLNIRFYTCYKMNPSLIDVTALVQFFWATNKRRHPFL